MSTQEYNEWSNFAIGIAKLCSSKIMQNFHQRSQILLGVTNDNEKKDAGNLQVSMKENNADLVTQTDQEVESTIRSMIQQRYPLHRFIGEESVAESSGKFLVFSRRLFP